MVQIHLNHLVKRHLTSSDAKHLVRSVLCEMTYLAEVSIHQLHHQIDISKLADTLLRGECVEQTYDLFRSSSLANKRIVKYQTRFE